MLREPEAGFREAIRELAQWRGWVVYYVPDSRWTDVRGWPDLVLARAGRVLFRELKTDVGKVSVEQQWWLDQLTAAGCDAGVWRPADRKRIERELE